MRWVCKYFFSFPIDGEINAYTEFRYQSTNKFFRMASQQQNFKRYQVNFCLCRLTLKLFCNYHGTIGG